MKDIRMEVRIARMEKGVKYTALFNIGPYPPLDGKRVTIENIRTSRLGYRVDIVEDTIAALPHELSEWREG